MVRDISKVASRYAIALVGWVLHREPCLSQGFSTIHVPGEGTAGESFWPKSSSDPHRKYDSGGYCQVK